MMGRYRRRNHVEAGRITLWKRTETSELIEVFKDQIGHMDKGNSPVNDRAVNWSSPDPFPSEEVH